MACFSVRTLNNDFGGGPRRAGRVPRLADVAAAVALVDDREPQEAASRVDADRQPRLALLRPAGRWHGGGGNSTENYRVTILVGKNLPLTLFPQLWQLVGR